MNVITLASVGLLQSLDIFFAVELWDLFDEFWVTKDIFDGPHGCDKLFSELREDRLCDLEDFFFLSEAQNSTAARKCQLVLTSQVDVQRY